MRKHGNTVNAPLPKLSLSATDRAQKTFLTHTDIQAVKYRLAEHEISQPTGVYNTELEEQEQNLAEITAILKQTQAEYEIRSAQLAAREKALEIRRQELMRRKAEIDTYVSRSKDKQNKNLRLTAKRYEGISFVMQEMSGLTDTIAGATALLSILLERNKIYGVYGSFIEAAHDRLLADSTFESGPADRSECAPVMRSYDNLRSLSASMDYVSGVYTRLTKEEASSLSLEQALSAEYDASAGNLIEKQNAHRVVVSALEQQVADLNATLDDLLLRHESLKTDNELLVHKLHTRTQEISEVHGAVKNLLERIAAVVEERHTFLTDRASIEDLLGGVGPELQQKVQLYHKEAKGLINMNECFNRVLGSSLLGRLRDIYKLSLALEDAAELVNIANDLSFTTK
ncbi:Hypothetical protein GLP15_4670 [Giardia lamblia P15]|uniref:DUF4200 domain-containing protein n=1 Tax=Giardia intestinalis (strain P15) TaxID=658858 RepID=E1F1T4_GIAIA|nr:Hypothetical protein GLP15_4670 [Giardia lamblia P15]